MEGALDPEVTVLTLHAASLADAKQTVTCPCVDMLRLSASVSSSSRVLCVRPSSVLAIRMLPLCSNGNSGGGGCSN